MTRHEIQHTERTSQPHAVHALLVLHLPLLFSPTVLCSRRTTNARCHKHAHTHTSTTPPILPASPLSPQCGHSAGSISSGACRTLDVDPERDDIFFSDRCGSSPSTASPNPTVPMILSMRPLRGCASEATSKRLHECPDLVRLVAFEPLGHWSVDAVLKLRLAARKCTIRFKATAVGDPASACREILHKL